MQEINNNNNIANIIKYAEISSYLINNLEIGELFMEDINSSTFIMDNGVITTRNEKKSKGFSLRAIYEDCVYIISNDQINENNIFSATKKMQDTIKINNNIKRTINGFVERNIYTQNVDDIDDKTKIELMKEINNYVYNKLSTEVKSLTKNLRITIRAVQQDVYIYNGCLVRDLRPMVNISMVLFLEKNEVFESVMRRESMSFIQKNWNKYANELIRKAEVEIKTQDFEGGKMPVVFASGLPGILLHEAIGHGLEADFINKNTSVFSDKLGSRIAINSVNIVDDGTLPGRAGSLNFDDEGTESQRNILVENGVLVEYLCDRLNGKRINRKSTGNGRRENYKSTVIPRMTNTFMTEGQDRIEDMISSIKRGIYAVDFRRGQVNITSGHFAFSGGEFYSIINGKICDPIRGCVLSGLGIDVLNSIQAVGTNLSLGGGGHCGKDGQTVPVDDGLPSCLVSGLTVGC